VPTNPRLNDHATPSSAATLVPTLLIVEDDPFVRPIYRRVLQGAGYQIIEAAGGSEALRLSEAHQGPIHLLLTDVLMPGLNGYQLAKQLLTHRPDLKVLYVTGYADNQTTELDELSANQAVLEKPFLPDVLVQRIRNLLDNGK
jgi:CheY-like chemotaxis protein